LLANAPGPAAPVRSNPHASQDLIQLFRLTDIADSVRRVDPRTGEKINKIRKSYEGKAKDLRLAGRNKAVSAPGQWIPNLLMVPDDDYHATRVLGKEMEKGLDDAFAAKLARAMSLVPGKLPDREAEQWRHILATDDPVPRPPPKPALAAPSVVPTAIAEQKQQAAAKVAAMAGASAATAAASSAAAATAAAATKAMRPERHGTKRSYSDASFVGYGEGFEDDETDSDGRSLASVRRKRRKVRCYHSLPFAFDSRADPRFPTGGIWRNAQLDGSMGQLEAGLYKASQRGMCGG
jgi:hypothetical protein